MMRNLVAVRISATAIADLVLQSAWMHDGNGPPRPFPDETRYLRAYYDPEIDSVLLILEHPSFYATAEGCQIVRIQAVMPPALLALGEGKSDDA